MKIIWQIERLETSSAMPESISNIVGHAVIDADNISQCQLSNVQGFPVNFTAAILKLVPNSIEKESSDWDLIMVAITKKAFVCGTVVDRTTMVCKPAILVEPSCHKQSAFVIVGFSWARTLTGVKYVISYTSYINNRIWHGRWTSLKLLF